MSAQIQNSKQKLQSTGIGRSFVLFICMSSISPHFSKQIRRQVAIDATTTVSAKKCVGLIMFLQVFKFLNAVPCVLVQLLSLIIYCVRASLKVLGRFYRQVDVSEMIRASG